MHSAHPLLVFSAISWSPQHIASRRANERKFSFIAGKVTSTWSLKTFLEFLGRNILLKFSTSYIYPHGWVAIAPACHVGDQGSIPWSYQVFLFSSFFENPPFFWDFQPPKKGLLYEAIRLGPSAFNPYVMKL